MRRAIFRAIADPARREIINLIAHGPLNLNSIAENFEVSRPAISKHIKILNECSLVTIKQDGREHYCSVDFSQFKRVSDWINQYRVFWEEKLDALGEFLEKEKANKPQSQKK